MTAVADPQVAEILAKAAPRRWWRTAVFGVLGVGTAVCAGVVGVAWFVREPAVDYVSKPVAKGDLVVSVTATGTLRAVGTVEVGAEVSGKLASVDADFNQIVHAGDVLARIDPEQLQAQVDQASAQVRIAEASLEQARATRREAIAAANRVDSQTADGLVSTQQVESAHATAERAKANVESAQANLIMARAGLDAATTKLDKAVIVAPIDGFVLARYVEQGQTVTAGFTTPVLFKLAKGLDTMELVVNVDEADVGRVKEKQDASFQVDAFAGRDFPSSVRSLYADPQSTSGVVTYQAILTVDNPDHLLLPGMTATASIVVDRRAGVLLAPNEALRFAPDNAPVDPNGLPRLWVDADGVPKPITVTLGASDGVRTEVSGDLPDGTEVIVDLRDDS